MLTITADRKHLRGILALLLCCYFSMPGIFAAELQTYTEDPSPPPLVLNDLQGKQHTLEDYRDQVVMVNFWAGWCHPCLQEIPELIRLAEILADHPFTILAVNVGESKQKLPGFVRKMEEHMVILLDTESEAFKRWEGIGLPSTFLLDGNGRIRYEAYGPVNWDAESIVNSITELIDKHSAEVIVER